MLQPSIYLNHFRGWVAKNHGAGLAGLMPRHFILALEMMRQRSPLHNVRILAHDPRNELPFWIYLYFQWLDTRVLPGSNPVIVQPNVKYRRRLARAFPSVTPVSLRTPWNIRGATSRMVAVVGADRCRRHSNHDDNFDLAMRALLPMLNPAGSIAIFTGDANRPRMAFGRLYAMHALAGPDTLYLVYDADHPAAILTSLLRYRRQVRAGRSTAAPPGAIPGILRLPGLHNLIENRAARMNRPRPAASPVLKIPLTVAAAAPAA